MTGFGRGVAESKMAAVQIELRSVNGKGLNLKLRVPSDRLELEPKVEALIRRQIQRGSVQGQVRVRVLERAGAVLDPILLQRYLKEWRVAAQSLKLDAADPSLADLLSLPGAVDTPPETEKTRQAVSRLVQTAAKEAVLDLVQSREREGAQLGKEFLALIKRMESTLKKVQKQLPKAMEAGAERMRERIEAAWQNAGITEPMDLARELAVVTDKADVREEVARLEIHIQRLCVLLEGGGPCGRELEFLSQECHREVTTLGNKSSDSRLSELVVDLKVAVQQLREQSANVE